MNRTYTPSYRAELVRYHQPGDLKGTPGEINILCDGKLVFSCKSLELPDRDNERHISCVPEGSYALVSRREGGFAALNKKKFGMSFVPWVRGVPNRSYILIHQGNRIDPHAPPRGMPHTQGCILVGTKHGMIEEVDSDDGWWAIWNSVKALRELYQVLQYPLAARDATMPFVIRNAHDEADPELTVNRGDI